MAESNSKVESAERSVIRREFQFLTNELGFKECPPSSGPYFFSSRFLRGRHGIEAGLDYDAGGLFEVLIVMVPSGEFARQIRMFPGSLTLSDACERFGVVSPPAPKRFMGLERDESLADHVCKHREPLRQVILKMDQLGLLPQ